MASNSSTSKSITTPKIVKEKNNKGFIRGKQVFNIGVVPNPNQHLYKYIKAEYAKIWLQHDMIRFDEPTRWKDKFEARFYTATYKHQNPDDTPALYALSLSTNKKSEASWLVYSDADAKKCVRLVFSMSKLRNAFERISQPDGMFYIGEINYGLNDSQITELHNKQTFINIINGTQKVPNNLYNEVFNNRFGLHSYLSLLLLKRQLFNHEHEVRCFFVPNKGVNMKKKIKDGQHKEFYNFSINDALVRIDFQESMEQSEKDFFIDWAFRHKVDYKEDNLYGKNEIIVIK